MAWSDSRARPRGRFRDRLLEQLQPFADQLWCESGQSRNVSARVRQAGHEPTPDRIVMIRHDDGDPRRGALGRLRRGCGPRDDDVHVEPNQLGRESGESVGPVPIPPALDKDVLALDVPQLRAQYDRKATIAARALGIEVHTFVLHRAGEFAAAFGGMIKNRDHGLLVMTTPFMFAHRREVIDLAATHRIVAVYEQHLYVRQGGLMCYGVNLSEMSRRAAVYLDKILRGAKPGDLPVEQPTTFELVINLKTAKALGLTIPPSLLARADEVIQ